MLGALLGCRPAPAEVPAQPDRAPDGRGAAMPESLRCRQATDCAPRRSCYWENPACVAVAAVGRPETCGDDADPPGESRPEIACDCVEGQCVPR